MAEDSVVQVRLEELKTVANRLTVNVLVYPKDSLYDVTCVHDPEGSDPDVKDDVVITLHRSKGSLVFDLGIALILISRPALALIVAIPMAMGRTASLPSLQRGTRRCFSPSSHCAISFRVPRRPARGLTKPATGSKGEERLIPAPSAWSRGTAIRTRARRGIP